MFVYQIDCLVFLLQIFEYQILISWQPGIDLWVPKKPCLWRWVWSGWETNEFSSYDSDFNNTSITTCNVDGNAYCVSVDYHNDYVDWF